VSLKYVDVFFGQHTNMLDRATVKDLNLPKLLS
jgi:hypothetical protein